MFVSQMQGREIFTAWQYDIWRRFMNNYSWLALFAVNFYLYKWSLRMTLKLWFYGHAVLSYPLLCSSHLCFFTSWTKANSPPSQLPLLCSFLVLFFSAIFLWTRLAYIVDSIVVEIEVFVFSHIFRWKSWSNENQIPSKSQMLVNSRKYFKR